MLQPHSFLWHYLWVGPHVLLAVLAFLTWRRGLYKLFPAFFVYLIFEAIQELTLYALDLLPSVRAPAYWRADIVGVVIEAFVKLAVIRELFANLVRPRPSVSRTGNRLIVCIAIVLAALGMLAAIHAPVAKFAILSYVNILEQTIYLIETGVMLFIFFLAAYFHLEWNRRDFGIALGLSISACVGLGVFAVFTNWPVFKWGYLLDFLDGGTYHACVIIWMYYLLSPAWPSASADAAPLSEITMSDAGPISPRLRKAQLIILEG